MALWYLAIPRTRSSATVPHPAHSSPQGGPLEGLIEFVLGQLRLRSGPRRVRSDPAKFKLQPRAKSRSRSEVEREDRLMNPIVAPLKAGDSGESVANRQGALLLLLEDRK